MEENNEKKKFKLIDLIKNKQYYAILNLSFYSILIIVLIIGVRSGESNNANKPLDNNATSVVEQKTIVEGFQNIKNRNFEFIYTLETDNVKTIYTGKQSNKKIYFKDTTNNKEYMIQENITLEKKGEQYILSDSPISYFNYVDIELIEKMLSKLTKDETDYIISLKEFVSIIEGEEQKEESLDDDIFVEIKKQNNVITELTFDITCFVNLRQTNIKEAKLNLKYQNFGLVEDFEIK